MENYIQRDNQHPYNTLEETVNFLKIIHEISGSSGIALIKEILLKLDLNHERSQRYLYLKSSAQQFGLLKSNKNGLRLTNLGLEMVAEKVPTETKFKALINSRLFRVLLYVYQIEALPNDKEMVKIIEEIPYFCLNSKNPDIKGINFKFSSKKIIERAAYSFKESIRYIGILKSDGKILIPEKFKGKVR